MRPVPGKLLPDCVRALGRKTTAWAHVLGDRETVRVEGPGRLVRLTDGLVLDVMPTAEARPEPGFVLVLGGIFRARPATVRCHLHPQDVALFCGVRDCQTPFPECLHDLAGAGRHDDVRRITALFALPRTTTS